MPFARSKTKGDPHSGVYILFQLRPDRRGVRVRVCVTVCVCVSHYYMRRPFLSPPKPQKPLHVTPFPCPLKPQKPLHVTPFPLSPQPPEIVTCDTFSLVPPNPRNRYM